MRLEPSRVTLWNPEIIGPYGGRKLKAGQAEGGHIPFETIAEFGFGVSEQGGHLVLVTHQFNSARWDSYVIDGGPVETAMTRLCERLRDFWQQRGHELHVPASLIGTGGEVSLRAQGVPVEYTAIEAVVR